MPVRIFVGKKRFHEIYPNKLARTHSLIETLGIPAQVRYTGLYPHHDQGEIELFNVKSKVGELYKLNGPLHWVENLAAQVNVIDGNVIVVLTNE